MLLCFKKCYDQNEKTYKLRHFADVTRHVLSPLNMEPCFKKCQFSTQKILVDLQPTKKTDAIRNSEILKENLDYHPDLLGGNSVNPTTLGAEFTDKKYVS